MKKILCLVISFFFVLSSFFAGVCSIIVSEFTSAIFSPFKYFSIFIFSISNDKTKDTKDYVLGKFNKEDTDRLNEIYSNLVNVIDDFCSISLEMLKSKYNNK